MGKKKKNLSQTSSAGKTVTPTWLQRQGGIQVVGKSKRANGRGRNFHPQGHTDTPQQTHTRNLQSTFWTTHEKIHSHHNLLRNTSSLNQHTVSLPYGARATSGWVHQNEAKEDQRDHYLPLFSAVSIFIYHLEAQATPAAEQAGCPPFFFFFFLMVDL